VQHQVRARRDPHGSGQLRLLLDVFTWSQLVVVGDHDHGLVVFGGLGGLDGQVGFMRGRW
jgi:hypothetical protein